MLSYRINVFIVKCFIYNPLFKLNMPHIKKLLSECQDHALHLLKENVTEDGLMAASLNEKSKHKSYHCIFGRDVAISALGMALTDSSLIDAACQGLETLAMHQAENGQIPKFVDSSNQQGDFWYIGCIDATLWWLIAIDFMTKHAKIDLRAKFSKQIEKAITWLHCQEHPKLYLVQQNEASDWADIMPRSGFVLYSNALWYQVKKIYHLKHLQETHYHFNHLFHPFSRDLPEYKRLRLLMHYIKRDISNHELYLSFVNFSYFGKEGDVFGNLLAIIFGLASPATSKRILKYLKKVQIDQPIPVRATVEPIKKNDPLWRSYMGRHRQNLEYQYHNSGIWPFIGGFWIIALAMSGFKTESSEALERLATINKEQEWKFSEWFKGDTYEAKGMAGQSWNAAMFLLAFAYVKMDRKEQIKLFS
jgi:hypothetical protein